MAIYLFSGFIESDLTAGTAINPGDTINVPSGAPTRKFEVTDDDAQLAGDTASAGHSDDTTQSGAIYHAGALETSGRVYVDSINIVEDAAGNQYELYEIEVEGSSTDYYAFKHPPPPPGTTLTVVSQNDSTATNVDYTTISGADVYDSAHRVDGHDSVVGGSGSDSIATRTGHDTLSGGAGNDTLVAGAGNDLVYGGTGSDRIRTETGDDTAFGGAEADIFYIDDGFGSDTLYGGESTGHVDIVDFGEIGSAGVVVTFTGAEAGTATSGSDSLAFFEIERLDLTDQADVAYGGVGSENVYADAGNDLLYGGAGADGLNAGSGDDTVFGGDGLDNLNGGSGADTLFGDAGNDLLFGGAGSDTLYGGLGVDTLEGSTTEATGDTFYGGAGGDAIFANFGDDLIYGGDDGDRIEGRLGADTIFGGAGNDMLLGYDGASTSSWNTVVGADDLSSDTIFGGAGRDTVAGGQGADFLYGGTGDDIVDGGDGDDRLEGDAGSDTIFGGAGNDHIETGAGGSTTLLGDDTVFAGAGDDFVAGDAGSDLIHGDGGDDRIEGRAGTDILYGGDGDDLLVGYDGVSTHSGNYSVAADDGSSDSLFSGTGNDTLASGSGADRLDAGSGADQVFAGAGADSIDGGSGADLIFGGDGADSIDGGSGMDTIQGGAGDDTISGGVGRSAFKWSDVADPHDGGQIDDNDPITTGTQTIDGIGVTFTVPTSVGTFATETVATQGIDTGDTAVNPNSALSLENGQAGIVDISLSSPVHNLQFRINDFESNTETVVIRAYDAANNPIEFHVAQGHLIGGANSDTATGNDTFQSGNVGSGDADLSTSVLVTIPGPVARFEIDFTSTTGSLTVSDIYFDNPDSSSAADSIDGGAGNDSILGEAGDDTLEGGLGADTLDGGTGADTIFGGDGADSIAGGAGGDTIHGGTGVDVIDGGTGADLIYGGDGADAIVLTDDFGADMIFAGESVGDVDVLDLSGHSGPLTIVASGDETGTIGDGTVVAGFTGIESVVGSNAGSTLNFTTNLSDISLAGGSGGDLIISGAGNDFINAGAGNDTVATLGGDDTVTLGAGSDTLYVLDGGGHDTITDFDLGSDVLNTQFLTASTGLPVSTANVVISDTVGDGTGDAILTFPDGTRLTLQGISPAALDGAALEAIGLPAGGDDVLVQNPFLSTAGADTINSGGGDDTVDSGDGDDSVFGATGNDSLFGGAGNDVLDGGIGDDRIEGGLGDDIVDGGAGDDSLSGGDGSDLIYGGDGEDVLSTGIGEDTLYGGAGHDALSNSMGNDTLFGGTGNDTLTATEGDDQLYGGDGDDTLFGGADDDLLFGGNGHDTLDGGTGNDVLTGGAGNDTFVVSGGDDTITDFGTGADRLDTSGLTDVGNGLTNQDGTVTADEVVVTGGGGSDQVLTFPGGETVTVPDGTVDTSTQATQFASLVAMGVPPCFAPGTLIMTDHGEVPVEELCIGNMVLTADRGPQPLRWIGRRTEVFESREDKQKPVEIKAGALGNDLPKRTLVVSPLHRMVLSGIHILAAFGEPEVLALSKALTGADHIRRMKGKERIDYYSLLFDRHEIIFAEGTPTESFRPGHVALAGFEDHVKEQIYAIYPRLRKEPKEGLGPPARLIVGRRETEELVTTQKACGMPLIAPRTLGCTFRSIRSLVPTTSGQAFRGIRSP